MINSTKIIFQLICLPFKNNYLWRKTSRKRLRILECNVYYVTQGVLLFIFSCCSLYIWLTYDWPFMKKGGIAWTGITCFQMRSIKKKWKDGRYSMEVLNQKYSTWYMKIIWKLQHEFPDARINCFRWWHFSSWFICFCAFKSLYCKKQRMYCFLPFGFINVYIFFINPSGSYSRFTGADLEYLNSLRYCRSSWSDLRYFNFKPSLKLWWCLARDFDESQILVISGGFQGFSRFLSLEISKLRSFVCIPFSPLCTI